MAWMKPEKTPYEILNQAIYDCINYYGPENMNQPFIKILTEAQVKAGRLHRKEIF